MRILPFSRSGPAHIPNQRCLEFPRENVYEPTRQLLKERGAYTWIKARTVLRSTEEPELRAMAAE